MTKKELTIVEKTSLRIRELEANGNIKFPVNYSPENALKSAHLILQETKTAGKEPVLSACNSTSIANALLDMVVQGLNPVKKQCYFIPYGKQLTLQRSYFGTVTCLKKNKNIKAVSAQLIYDGDQFKYQIKQGRIVVTLHEQDFFNVNKDKILGAYCTIVDSEDKEYTTIMTMEQIKQAWKQSRMNPVDAKGNITGKTHKNFTEEMAKKTVINRGCKMFMNTTLDDDLFSESFNRTSDNEYKSEPEIIQDEIDENQASETMDFEEAEIVIEKDKQPEKAEEQQPYIPF